MFSSLKNTAPRTKDKSKNKSWRRCSVKDAVHCVKRMVPLQCAAVFLEI